MTLSDRFVRRGHDPLPLIKKGLLNELIKRVKLIGDTSNSTDSTPQSIGTVVSIISTLCRGSDAAAHVSHPS